MEKFDPIDIEFLINSGEVKIEAKKVKEQIKGIGETADVASAKVSGTNAAGTRGAAGTSPRGGKGGIAGGMKGAGNAAAKAGKQAAASKPQWNGLGNSINQISRELPAFTYSAQTGLLAISNNLPILADEIGRLKTKNEALIASGKKGVPVWRQVVKGLLSWQTALSLGVAALTIFGPKLFDMISNLFKGKEALDKMKESKELLNKAFEGSEFTNAVKEISLLRINLDLAKEGLLDKKIAVDQYNESIGQTAKDAKTLDDVEQGLVKNADLYIEMTLKKAAANLALEDGAKRAYEAAQLERKEAEEFQNLGDETTSSLAASGGLSGSMWGGSTFNISEYQKNLKEAGEQRKAAQIKQKEEEKKISEEIAAELQKDYAEAYDKLRDPDDGDPDSGTPKVLNDRKKLLEKVADLDREYARKRFDQDKQELDALREKFDKVRTLIEKFNNDPKNKAKRIGLGELDESQAKAEEALIYKQETSQLKEELDKQRELYKEIETYKANFGEEKTRQRYAKELEQFESFADLLRAKKEENKDAFAAVEDGAADNGQQERVRLLEDLNKQELVMARERYEVLLKEYQDYQQKRKLLTERFEKEYQQLIASGDFNTADERKRVYEEELRDLEAANLKKKDEYKALFKDIRRLTIAEGEKLIEQAKQYLINNDITDGEIYERIQRLIADIEDAQDRIKSDKLFKIASAFGEIGEELSQIGADLNDPALNQLGNFLLEVANGMELVDKAFDKENDFSDNLMVGIQAAVNILGMIAGASAQRKRAEEEYYRSLIGMQQSYNVGLNEQLRLQAELGENVWLTDYEGRLLSGTESLNNATEKHSEAMEKLAEGRAKVDQRDAVDWGNVGSGTVNGLAAGAAIGSIIPVIGTVIGGVVGAVGGFFSGLFGGKKKKNEWGSLLQEYPELLKEISDGVIGVNEDLANSLLENELLDESTQQIVENVLEWQEAIEKAREQIKQVVTELTGSLGDDLRNSLVDAFQSGEDAAVAMGDTVEKILENVVSNKIFNRIFSDTFSKLEDEMAASYDLGGDNNWVDDFSRFFDEASGLNEDFEAAMEAARRQAGNYGFDIFEPTESEDEKPQGLQGTIRREMTEETASELTGLFRGQFDITKRHFQLDERRFEIEQRHYNTTMAIMQSSALIEQNTAATVVQLQLAVIELTKIKDNTKSQTARDIGR